ncbi:MAG TPA: FG-GAP-like repeat-containing protein [Pyrinomonadaceae bacterium]
MVSECSTINGGFAFCAVRLNENGLPDATFTGGFLPPPGYVIDTMGAAPGGGGVRGVAIQNDGKLVLVGYANQNLAMVRFNPNGSLDSSFGSGGKVFTDVTPGDNDRANELAIQPDGKIVVVGYSEHQGSQSSTYQQFVARYATDGMLDASFGTGGIVRTTIAGQDTSGQSIVIQADGKILAGGHMSTMSGSPSPSASYLLTRLNPDGSPDATWDGDGVVSIVYGASGFPGTNGFLSLALQADGRVVALGHGNIIYRFNTDGSLDTGFDGDGSRPALPVALNDETPFDLIISAGGRIMVVGHSRPGPSFSHQYAVARYRQDGSPDTGFSSDGYLDIDVGSGPDSAMTVAADSQGRIVIAGTTGLGQIPNPLIPGVFSAARLVPSVVPVAVSGRTDFDGDGRTDLSVFRPSDGYWYITQSSNQAFRAQQFGVGSDQIVPGDYDGDGKTDFAIWRPSTATWYTSLNPATNYGAVQFGASGDVPSPGDYDGDGKSDIAVYRPSESTFYLLYSSNGSFHFQFWGESGDLPVPGDYDGDSKTDFAIFRPSSSAFYVLRSIDGAVRGQQWGASGDKIVAGDYDGDGKTDFAVYRPSTSGWYYLQSSDNSFRGVAWGASGDVPAAGDYDSDGKWDVAVFRPSTGTFYILPSSTNALRADRFGANGDVPVAGAFVR